MAMVDSAIVCFTGFLQGYFGLFWDNYFKLYQFENFYVSVFTTTVEVKGSNPFSQKATLAVIYSCE